MVQPLNEAYDNELLESYQKMQDILGAIDNLIASRIPYEYWPPDCKIAGIEEKELGKFNKCIDHGLECECSLEKSIEEGWEYLQSNQRHDVSMRIMTKILFKWKKVFNKTEALPKIMVERLISIGKAQEKLSEILDDDIFETLSKHNEYWDSEHEIESDKLDDSRRKFSYISEKLWNVWGLLKYDPEE